MEQEFIQNQERLKPQEEKNQVQTLMINNLSISRWPMPWKLCQQLLAVKFMNSNHVGPMPVHYVQEERLKVDELRGSPMGVGNLEEIIDDNHAIVSSSVGPEYYVNIMSFVDKDALEPGCSVLLHHKVCVRKKEMSAISTSCAVFLGEWLVSPSAPL